MSTEYPGNIFSEMGPRSEGCSTDHSLVPPCQAACPLHMNIREYIDLVAQGRTIEALRIIRNDNPFPSICAYICNHPCEEKCRRGQVDEPIAIRALKRFAVESGGDKTAQLEGEMTHEEKIACVGSGPAGLACALYLRKLGYAVTIFEAQAEVGGMLRNGIPQYRLPQAALDAEIGRLTQIGVEFKVNTRVESLNLLFNQGYKAIFVTIGAQQSRRLGIPGENKPGMVDAIAFLREVNLGLKPVIGEKILVIGGGNVAIDSARTALRLGAKEVNLVCLESSSEIPASKSEVQEAIEEGVKINYSWGVKSITGEDKVSGVELKRCTTVYDSQHRFNPVYDENVTQFFTAQTVITAIGQMPQVPEEFHLRIGRGSTIQVDPVTLNTNQRGVFAGGDAVTGPATVVQALATGRRAAFRIDEFLQHKYPHSLEDEKKSPIGDLSPKTIEYIRKIHRNQPVLSEPEARIKEFNPVEMVYNWEAAISEARRCLRCGAGAEILFKDKCATCLTCLRDCPYKVPVLDERGTLQIPADQCLACGICVTQCPAKAIVLRKTCDQQNINEELNQISRATRETKVKPLIVGFVCQYGLFGTGILSGLGKALSPGVSIIPVLCAVKVEAEHLLRAFEIGADGVFIAGCGERCARRDTAFWVNNQVQRTRKMLDEIGMDIHQLQFYSSETNGDDPAKWLEIFVQEIGGLFLTSMKKKES